MRRNRRPPMPRPSFCLRQKPPRMPLLLAPITQCRSSLTSGFSIGKVFPPRFNATTVPNGNSVKYGGREEVRRGEFRELGNRSADIFALFKDENARSNPGH